jgi:hypothetical protein
VQRDARFQTTEIGAVIRDLLEKAPAPEGMY